MQYEITDEAAIEFSRSFYRAVAYGLPVDAAATVGRTAVSMGTDSTLEWVTPVLYMRSPDGHIFDVSPEAFSPSAEPALLQETEEWQGEGSLRQYRESLESIWAGEGLNRREAERLKDLANTLGLSPSAAAETEREVMGDTIEAILARQEQAAREEERKNRLDELYTRARKLHRNERWQAVVDVFDQIHALDPEYPDPEGLLATAREALVALKRERRVAAIYDEGL